MSKLAFLGAGNMAGAIVDGLLARSPELRSEIICLGGSGKSAATLAERTGIRVAKDIDELLHDADVVVVAFKPQQLSAADARIGTLARRKLVISVLAGKTLEILGAKFPAARNIVRTMPNTPAQRTFHWRVGSTPSSIASQAWATFTQTSIPSVPSHVWNAPAWHPKQPETPTAMTRRQVF